MTLLIEALGPALRLVLVLALLCGVAYPLGVTGLAQALWPYAAGGSLIRGPDGRPLGSALIGQDFPGPEWFHLRPSATTPEPYNAAASAGRNLAPSAQALADQLAARIAALKAENLAVTQPPPVELVTASASGLDPHLTPAGVAYQLPRVARARGVTPEALMPLVAEVTERRTLGLLGGLLGEPRINLLRLNQRLAERYPVPR